MGSGRGGGRFLGGSRFVAAAQVSFNLFNLVVIQARQRGAFPLNPDLLANLDEILAIDLDIFGKLVNADGHYALFLSIDASRDHLPTSVIPNLLLT